MKTSPANEMDRFDPKGSRGTRLDPFAFKRAEMQWNGPNSRSQSMSHHTNDVSSPIHTGRTEQKINLMFRIRPILFVLLFLPVFHLSSPGSLTGQIVQPDGELEPTDSDDFWPHTLSGNTFSELWTYQVYLDNGTKIHAVFTVGNFGNLKSAVSGLRLSVLFPDGETYHLAREYPLERLVQDRENHRLRFHPERDLYIDGKLPEEHKITIDTQKNGVIFKLFIEFENIQPGFKWGSGIYRIGNQDVGIITHIPYAEVTANGEVGDHTFDGAGTAYMDHTFQFQSTTKMLEEGYRFVRHHSPTQWDILYALRPNDDNGSHTLGHLIQRRNGKPRLEGVDRVHVESRERAFGKSVAKRVHFQKSNEEMITIERQEDQERFSLFSELSWLARQAARTFLGGEVVDIRGIGRLRDAQGTSLEGEYNFFIVD